MSTGRRSSYNNEKEAGRYGGPEAANIILAIFFVILLAITGGMVWYIKHETKKRVAASKNQELQHMAEEKHYRLFPVMDGLVEYIGDLWEDNLSLREKNLSFQESRPDEKQAGLNDPFVQIQGRQDRESAPPEGIPEIGGGGAGLAPEGSAENAMLCLFTGKGDQAEGGGYIKDDTLIHMVYVPSAQPDAAYAPEIQLGAAYAPAVQPDTAYAPAAPDMAGAPAVQPDKLKWENYSRIEVDLYKRNREWANSDSYSVFIELPEGMEPIRRQVQFFLRDDAYRLVLQNGGGISLNGGTVKLLADGREVLAQKLRLGEGGADENGPAVLDCSGKKQLELRISPQGGTYFFSFAVCLVNTGETGLDIGEAGLNTGGE